MDELVSNWVEKRFSAHKPLNTISDALSGLHYFLASTKKKPPFSWKPFSAWRRYEVPSRAPPITADLVLGFAGKCLANLDLIMAALLLLGFHCCLRTGELFLLLLMTFWLIPRRVLFTLKPPRDVFDAMSKKVSPSNAQ